MEDAALMVEGGRDGGPLARPGAGGASDGDALRLVGSARPGLAEPAVIGGELRLEGGRVGLDVGTGGLGVDAGARGLAVVVEEGGGALPLTARDGGPFGGGGVAEAGVAPVSPAWSICQLLALESHCRRLTFLLTHFFNTGS